MTERRLARARVSPQFLEKALNLDSSIHIIGCAWGFSHNCATLS